MYEIRALLMPYSVYLKTETRVPYFFKIVKENQMLYYFGSNHSYDPANKQYPLLTQYWDEFTSKTSPANSVVFVEGGVRPVAHSKTEAISNGAEGNFITYLAHQKQFKTTSPEPGRVTESKHLLSKYTKEQIQYYYFARVVNQWGNMKKKPRFEEYISGFLESDKKESGWNDFDFSLSNMKSIHRALFNGDFDERNTSFFYSITNPTFRTTVINSFVQDQGVERDAYITEQIVNTWHEGRNIFVVFGHTHAVVQEPALKKLL